MLELLLVVLAFYALMVEKSAVLFFGAIIALFLVCFSGKSSYIVRGGGKSWVDEQSLIDPKFNMREVIKQLILLEDHLFHDNKHCRDCITKHFMTIEGYLDEAQTMKTDDPSQVDVARLRAEIKQIGPDFLMKYTEQSKPRENEYIETANKLRALRKEYAQKYAVYQA